MERRPFARQDRVGDLLQQILAEILLRKIHHHPSLEGVTVTAVRVTKDLRTAHVFWRVLEPEARAKAERCLRALAGFMRREVGSQLRLRHTPELHFEYDESLEQGSRIEALLSSLRPSGTKTSEE